MRLSIVCLMAIVVLAQRPCYSQTQQPDTLKEIKPVVIDTLAVDVGDRLQIALDDFDSFGSDRAIGVTVSPADLVIRRHVAATKGKYGLVVTNVFKNSPAAKAGVKPHDLILSANANFLANRKDLRAVVKGAKKSISLTVLRSGKPINLTVSMPPLLKKRAVTFAREMVLYPNQSKYVIGISTKPVDKTLVKQLVLPPLAGSVITLVAPKGPAGKAGLKEHDIILRVGKIAVQTVADLGKELDKAKGRSVTIEFLRAGRKLTSTVTPKLRVVHFREQTLVVDVKLLRTTEHLDILTDLKVGSTDTLKPQLSRLSKQVTDLQKTLDALKKSVAELKHKKK